MNRRASHAERGFTLLELVLVMVIIAIALSMVAPRLGNFSRGRTLHNVADDFVATTRIARSQAISQGTIYRITIDAKSAQYQLTRQDGQNFVAVPNDSGQLPDGIQIEMRSTQDQTMQSSPLNAGASTAQPAATTPQDSIDFFPSGRTQTAQVKLTTPGGDSLLIECPSAAEDFAIVSQPNP